jgi:hypothetical protein
MHTLKTAKTSIFIAGFLVLALASETLGASRSGQFGLYDQPPQDDWWNSCPYAFPCDDAKPSRVPRPFRPPKLEPFVFEYTVPKVRTRYVKSYYEGPGSKPSAFSPRMGIPNYGGMYGNNLGNMIVVADAPVREDLSLRKTKPGIHRTKKGTILLVKVSKMAAPLAFKHMKAYNKGARNWNRGPQTGFTGGGIRPNPVYGGGLGWKKVKATPYRSRHVGFIPKASPKQALTGLASAFASAVNGEATVVKVGGISKPKPQGDNASKRPKAKKHGGA